MQSRKGWGNPVRFRSCLSVGEVKGEVRVGGWRLGLVEVKLRGGLPWVADARSRHWVDATRKGAFLDEFLEEPRARGR